MFVVRNISIESTSIRDNFFFCEYIFLLNSDVVSKLNIK